MDHVDIWTSPKRRPVMLPLKTAETADVRTNWKDHIDSISKAWFGCLPLMCQRVVWGCTASYTGAVYKVVYSHCLLTLMKASCSPVRPSSSITAGPRVPLVCCSAAVPGNEKRNDKGESLIQPFCSKYYTSGVYSTALNSAWLFWPRILCLQMRQEDFSRITRERTTAVKTVLCKHSFKVLCHHSVYTNV